MKLTEKWKSMTKEELQQEIKYLKNRIFAEEVKNYADHYFLSGAYYDLERMQKILNEKE